MNGNPKGCIGYGGYEGYGGIYVASPLEAFGVI
jgi:hypothetical protein